MEHASSVSMNKRSPVTVDDVKPGQVLWLSQSTACNDEGHSSVPILVLSVDEEDVQVVSLGRGHGIGAIARGQIDTWGQKGLFDAIKKGKATNLFRAVPETVSEHLSDEREWVASQQAFLTKYLGQLDQAASSI